MSEPEARPSGGTILGRVPEAPAEDVKKVQETFVRLAAGPLDLDAHEAGTDEGEVRGPPAQPAVAVARSANSRARAALIGCVILALAALGCAVVALQQRSALTAQTDQSNELRDVSGRTIAALTSYDYQHLDQWKKSVLANATGSFQNQFQAGFAGFEQAYVAEHNRGTGSVQNVWIGPVASGKATSVVLVQITVTSLTGTHSLDPYVQVTLLKVAGRWRVDDVQATFDTSGGGGSSGVTTPATTLPPSGSTPTSVP